MTQADLSPVFHALSDPTRRAILARLAAGPATVGEVAAPFPMSAPAVTKHLKVLEAAGLLRRERHGRTHVLHLAPHPLKDAAAWIDHTRAFWEQSLDRLDALLAELDDPERP